MRLQATETRSFKGMDWFWLEVEFLDDLGMREGVPLGLARDGLEEADLNVSAILAFADAEEVHDIAPA